NTDRHEPIIADVTGRMKDEALGRKLIVKLFDQRLEYCPLEPQPELGDAALEKLFVTQRCPIGRFHLAHGITGEETVTPSNERGARLPTSRAGIDTEQTTSLPRRCLDCNNGRQLRFAANEFVFRICFRRESPDYARGTFISTKNDLNIVTLAVWIQVFEQVTRG